MEELVETGYVSAKKDDRTISQDVQHIKYKLEVKCSSKNEAQLTSISGFMEPMEMCFQ